MSLHFDARAARILENGIIEGLIRMYKRDLGCDAFQAPLRLPRRRRVAY